MRKKIIAVSIILVGICFSLYYYKIQLKYHKHVADGGAFYEEDIIAMNKDHFDPMGDQLLSEAYGYARKYLASDFQIIERPVEEKVGRSINWYPENNLQPTLYLYTRDGVYVGSQANILLAGFIITPDFSVLTYDEYLAVEEVEKILLDYDGVNEEYLPHMLIYRQGESLQKVYQRGKKTLYRPAGNTVIPLKSFLRFVSVAFVHASIHCLTVRKTELVKKVLAKTFQRGMVVDLNSASYLEMATDHVKFSKNSDLWINAYKKQHRVRNQQIYEDSYHHWLAVVIAFAIPIPFFVVQLFRTDLKKLIREEMVRQTLDLDRYDLDMIAARLPGDIIFQPSDRFMRAKIQIVLQPLVQEARTRALQLKKERRQRNRQKKDDELNRKADQLLEEILEYELDDNVFTTVDKFYARATGSNETLKHRKKALQVLQRELNRLCSIKDKKDGLKEMRFSREFKRLLREEKVSGSFPKVSRTEPDEDLLKVDEELVESDDLIEVQSSTDDYLFKSEKKSTQFKTGLLAGKNVIVCTGAGAHGTATKFLKWVEDFGAKSVQYIPSFKKSRLSKAMASADLAIVLLPADHNVTHIAQRFGVKCVYLTCRSEKRFKAMVMERLG